MTGPPIGDSERVSVGITRRVKPGRGDAFEAWLDEIRDLASGFTGYAGMDVVRPVDPANPTYVIILRFDRYEQYAAWHDSSERASAVERSLELTVGDPVLEVTHGLEGWFTPPAAGLQRPARYKMTILTLPPGPRHPRYTIGGRYPLIVVIGALVAALTGLPATLITLVTIIIVAAVATYWVMPWVTKLFRPWLFPKS